MSTADRRSWLIIEELQRIAMIRERKEVTAIRAFTAAWHRATQGGNPAAMGIRIKKAKKRPDVMVISVEMAGFGMVRWLPAIIVPTSDRLTRIMQECGDLSLFPPDRVRKTDVWGVPEPPRQPPVSQKVNIELVTVT
jgi:hypothetical protein